MNIFHELAEKAFEGRYFVLSPATIRNDLYIGEHTEEFLFWDNPEFDSFCGEFYEATNDEQALALLFIGEMYDAR